VQTNRSANQLSKICRYRCGYNMLNQANCRLRTKREIDEDIANHASKAFVKNCKEIKFNFYYEKLRDKNNSFSAS